MTNLECKKARHPTISSPLVLHDQKNDIYGAIATYEEHLRRAGLPNIPFHSTPLIYGTHIYKTLSPEQRKRLLVQFASFVRHLPIQYVTFTYTSKEFKNTDNLHKRIRRDIVHFIYENYQFLQTFSSLKIFYDNGQKTLSHALRDACTYMLSDNSTLFPETHYRTHHLAQVADFICSIELAELKYRDNLLTRSDERFYGKHQNFRRNYLKLIRRKRHAP